MLIRATAAAALASAIFALALQAADAAPSLKLSPGSCMGGTALSDIMAAPQSSAFTHVLVSTPKETPVLLSNSGLRLGSEELFAPIASELAPETCKLLRSDEKTLSIGTSLTAGELLALQRVYYFRKTYSWPLGTLDLADSNTAIATFFDEDVIVVRIVNLRGINTFATCRGVEDYIVSGTSVKPYNACAPGVLNELPRSK